VAPNFIFVVGPFFGVLLPKVPQIDILRLERVPPIFLRFSKGSVKVIRLKNTDLRHHMSINHFVIVIGNPNCRKRNQEDQILK